MNLGALLSVTFVILGLLAFLIPLYALIRWPGTVNLGIALRLIGGGLLASFFLTIALAAAFQVLAALVPGLNPYDTPAFESIDAGLFGVFVGLTLALLLICVGQTLLIRSKLQKERRKK